MFEEYITLVSLIVVLRGFLVIPYTWVLRRTKLAYKGRNFILTKWFGSSTNNYWKCFWFSILWLLVYYKQVILNFLDY